MGNGVSVCFTGGDEARRRNKEMNMMISDPYEEGLGHSFCYVRPDLTTATTTTSVPSSSKVHSEEPTSVFRSISGASVSANTSTPLSTTFIDSYATATTTSSSAFESSTSFASIPLQPIPRNSIHSAPFFSGASLGVPNSGPLTDRGFMSGPIERGFLSGPLDRGGSLYSGPLEKGPSAITSAMSFRRSLSHGGWTAFGPRSRPRSLIRGLRRAISKTLNRGQSSIVAPVKGISSIKYPDNWIIGGGGGGPGNEKHNELTVSSVNFSSEGSLDDVDSLESQNLQWAQGKAGEDRVHVVVSEEHGWVFVGIYDGFNGPDATDFLLSNLYPAVHKELKGLLWDDKFESSSSLSSSSSCATTALSSTSSVASEYSGATSFSSETDVSDNLNCERNGRSFGTCSQCLDQECYPCVSGDSSFDPNSRLKKGRGLKNRYRSVAKKREENQRRWKCEWDRERLELDRRLKEQLNQNRGGAVNHADVLKALSQALKKTEEAYLDIADRMVSENPELALMGSCVLVMLMKGQDVYVMNVGDSRAVLAQKAEPDLRLGKLDQDLERINEETLYDLEVSDGVRATLNALQLTTDHSTSVEEEVQRIRHEHSEDAGAVMNDRVKGSLKVTRAFGAGFLKQPKWNDALLEMFRIDYIGTSPYINCLPYLYHQRLGPKDRFLILSSDGLYQYFTNEEAVSEVELFISLAPEGDPAQHLVEELLFRAAKKAGLDFYDLLEIPQGERRRYHDDVSIIVISFEGRIWRSCV